MADALRYTFQLFGGDARKESPVPVMSHLLNVCAIVQRDGGSEDDAIAALLHDALEDKPEETSEAQLLARYGPRVARMVRIATDTPPEWIGGRKPPWKQRKQDYLDKLAAEPPDLLRHTIADKIDNVQAMLADHRHIGNALWSRFKADKHEQLWYYTACHAAYKKAGASPALVRELGLLINRLERIVVPKVAKERRRSAR